MSGYVLLEQIEAVDDVLQRWHKEADFLQAVAQAKKDPFLLSTGNPHTPHGRHDGPFLPAIR